MRRILGGKQLLYCVSRVKLSPSTSKILTSKIMLNFVSKSTSSIVSYCSTLNLAYIEGDYYCFFAAWLFPASGWGSLQHLSAAFNTFVTILPIDRLCFCGGGSEEYFRHPPTSLPQSHRIFPSIPFLRSKQELQKDGRKTRAPSRTIGKEQASTIQYLPFVTLSVNCFTVSDTYFRQGQKHKPM